MIRNEGEKSSSDPMISIVTAVYNGGQYLEKTIKSVVSQDYASVEYIIIDGGSKDDTINIIKKYEENIDYWISEPDKGIADAMNKGISVARGEIITFLNAGDYYINVSVLAYISKWYKREKWWWAYGLANFLLDYKETIFRQKYRPFKRWKYYYITQNCHQATFFRRELFQVVGSYILDNSLFFDVDFFIRATNFSEPSTSRKHLVWYDVTGISASISFKRLLSRLGVTKKYCSSSSLPLWGFLVVVRWFKTIVSYFIKAILLVMNRVIPK